MALRSSPTPSFTLRPAQPDDFDAYMDAFEAVAAEGRWMGAEAPIDRPVRRPGFDQAVAGKGSVLYLAEDADDRDIVGAIYASLAGGVVDLGMFVVDGYRGGGVGSALLEAVIDWARGHQAHKISLAAWPTNSPAISLYAHFGFRIEGTRRRHYRRRNGDLWDSVVMGLILDESSPGGPSPGAAKPERPSIVLPEGGISGLLADGGRVVLRDWHRSDIPALVAAIDGMDGRHWLTAIPDPYNADHAADYIAFTRSHLTAGTAAELAVVVDGGLAGAVGLRLLPEPGSGEIGYWVAAPARRRGVASTAARLLSDFGFGSLGLRRIQLNAAVANAASRRAAEKAGFELEGVRRAWRLINGVPTDHCVYSRIAAPA